MMRYARSRRIWLAAGAIGAVVLACAPTVPDPPGAARSGAVASLATSTAPTNVAQPQPAPGSCHARGSGVFSLPDPRCTPGAIDPAVSQRNIGGTICRRGYTRTVRPPEWVTEPEKRASIAAYGDTGRLRAFEYDHLVPLALAGSANDPANLWPEPGASPNPKDALEGRLAELVCERQVSLSFAQRLIARDWITAGEWVHKHLPWFGWRAS